MGLISETSNKFSFSLFPIKKIKTWFWDNFRISWIWKYWSSPNDYSMKYWHWEVLSYSQYISFSFCFNICWKNCISFSVSDRISCFQYSCKVNTLIFKIPIKDIIKLQARYPIILQEEMRNICYVLIDEMRFVGKGYSCILILNYKKNFQIIDVILLVVDRSFLLVTFVNLFLSKISLCM